MRVLGSSALAMAMVQGSQFTDHVQGTFSSKTSSERRLVSESASDCVSPDYVMRLEAKNYDDVAGKWTDSSGHGNDAYDHELEEQDVDRSFTTKGFYGWTCCKFENQVSKFVDIEGSESDGQDETITDRQCKTLCSDDYDCVAFSLVSTDVPIQHKDCGTYYGPTKRYACELHYQSGHGSPFLDMLKCKPPTGVYKSCTAKVRHVAAELGTVQWDTPRQATGENGEPVVRFKTQLEDVLIHRIKTGIQKGDPRTLCFKSSHQDTDKPRVWGEIFGISTANSIDFGNYHPTDNGNFRGQRIKLRSYTSCGDDRTYYSEAMSVPTGVHTFCILGDADRTQVWMDGSLFLNLDEAFFDSRLTGLQLGIGSARFSRKYDNRNSDRGFVGDIYEMVLYKRWLMEWEITKMEEHFTRNNE